MGPRQAALGTTTTSATAELLSGAAIYKRTRSLDSRVGDGIAVRGRASEREGRT